MDEIILQAQDSLSWEYDGQGMPWPSPVAVPALEQAATTCSNCGAPLSNESCWECGWR